MKSRYLRQILSMHFILFLILAIDCVWGEWVAGQCSTTCGIGSRVSAREKLVEEANGGNCSGRSTKTEECTVQECPGTDLRYLRQVLETLNKYSYRKLTELIKC